MDVISYLIGKNSGGGEAGNYSMSLDCTLTYYTTYGLKSLINDIKPFDTTGITSFEGFFSGCSGIKTVPVLDLKNADTISLCFSACTSFETMPLWDTKNITTMPLH